MNTAPHATKDLYKRLGLPLPNFARTSKPTVRMYANHYNKGTFMYPLQGYNMWRGNHNKYKYTGASLSHFGEGSANRIYHQHYKHAKCDTDYGKGGREFEYMSVKRGKMVQKPLPAVQYVDPKEKPVWLFKSWHGSLANSEIWQREVQYANHVPEHLGAKRPLSVLAPRTSHKTVHNAHMDKITVTICPFQFGFGNNLNKAVMAFYRRCICFDSPFPNDKVFLYYSIEPITPKVEVTWVDGSIYEPPLLEGASSNDIVQMVMEQSWIAGDRIAATGKSLQPVVVDDYKWQQVALVKRKKKATK